MSGFFCLKIAGDRTIQWKNKHLERIKTEGGKLMLAVTEEELDAMEAVDVRTVDINTLTDLRDIKINTKLPVEKKALR